MYGLRGIAPAECSAGTSWTCGKSTDCSNSLNWALAPACWGRTPGEWALAAGVVAPVGAPSGSVLTTPPASGADAQATVDALLNQQMIDQQAKDASGVQYSMSDSIFGGTAAAVSSFATAIPMWAWIGLAGVAGFALVAAGGGSPRRYGR